MRAIEELKSFKRDLKRLRSTNLRDEISRQLARVLPILAADEPLSPAYRDHALIGTWKGCRDCHLKFDLVLIYRKSDNLLELVRLGTHTDLFD